MNRAKVAAARAKLAVAQDAVFTTGANGRTDIPFRTCLAQAPEPVRTAYVKALDTVDAAETAAVAKGRAYWSPVAGLTFYS